MKIFEIADVASTEPGSNDELLGLMQFLAGQAEDTNGQKQIPQQVFIKLAQSLGISVNPRNLADLTIQEPLSNLVEPLQPGSNDPIVLKGGDPVDVGMPVNQAQDIVAAAAKKAASKDRGV